MSIVNVLHSKDAINSKKKITSHRGMYRAHYFFLSSYFFSVAGLDHTKFGFYQFQSFLFIVVIVISILLKTTFSQISIHSQLLVKILWRSDKEKRYGL